MKKLNEIKTSVLARFLGVTPPFISSVKKGRVSLPPYQARKISTEFKIPLYELDSETYPKSIFEDSINQQ